MATPSAQQHHNQQNQDYFRSVSSESTTYMMVPTGGPSGTTRREAPSKMWLAMVVIVVVVLQIASTTGLFVYLNMSISQVSTFFDTLGAFRVHLCLLGGVAECVQRWAHGLPQHVHITGQIKTSQTNEASFTVNVGCGTPHVTNRFFFLLYSPV
ncbi:hypothetical protein GOODEAATRI_019622 [Goodea atripinnis]|uniref:Uncharacterized protein n=1 Tax=Goodea atripinnis TaxID=208336 RepID=A0ABV0PFH1_9TELE